LEDYPAYKEALAQLASARDAAGQGPRQCQAAEEAAARDEATKKAAQAALDAAVKEAEQKAALRLREARVAWWMAHKAAYRQLSQALLDSIQSVLKTNEQRLAFERLAREIMGDEERIDGFVLVPVSQNWFRHLQPEMVGWKEWNKQLALALDPPAVNPLDIKLAEELVARGLRADLAIGHVCGTADRALIRQVIDYFDAEMKAGSLGDPVAALRSMLNGPKLWGFQRTLTGWNRPAPSAKQPGRREGPAEWRHDAEPRHD